MPSRDAPGEGRALRCIRGTDGIAVSPSRCYFFIVITRDTKALFPRHADGRTRIPRRTIMPPPIPVSPGSKTECLPWECYVLRAALDADAQLEVLDRVGKLAGGGFSTWPTRASSQDHPMIITSHTANATRSRECRRACGLAKCMGHCGRHVGALVERPEEMYGLANDVAAKIARDLGETGFGMDFFSSGRDGPADDGAALDDGDTNDGEHAGSDVTRRTRPFAATHFWGLVYGGRVAGKDRPGKGPEEAAAGENAVLPTRAANADAVNSDVFNNVTFGGASLSGNSTRRDGRDASGASHDASHDTPNGGRMASHLDRPVGWTLSVSVGKPVAFVLGRPPAPDAAMYGDFAAEKADASPEQKPPGVVVVVRSGDALLFRGHAVFHAVDGFAEDEGEDALAAEEGFGGGKKRILPEAWRERLLAPARAAPCAGWRPERLALLFRHEVDSTTSAGGHL